MPSTVPVPHLLAQNQEQLQENHLILDKVKAIFCSSRLSSAIQYKPPYSFIGILRRLM